VPVPVYPDNKPNPLADCILWCLGLVFGVGGSPSRGKVLPESFSQGALPNPNTLISKVIKIIGFGLERWLSG